MAGIILQEERVTLSFEVLLVLGIVGFYLFDSAMLLYANEMVFVETNGKWAFVCSAPRWLLMGKRLYVPNPLTPDAHSFRVCWSPAPQSDRQEDPESLRQFLGGLAPLRYMVLLLSFSLFAGLPLVLFQFGSGLGVLLFVGAIYLTIAAMLVHTFLRREVLSLSGTTFARLAFDSLACAPFAINIVRKITLHRSLAGDPISFAKNAFDSETFKKLVGALCNRLDEEMGLEEKGSIRRNELQTYRDRITGMMT